MTINERRLEILEWEKNNRTLNNRSFNAFGCAYEGYIGCAVGRLIADKNLCKKLDREHESSVVEYGVFCQLPSDVQQLEQGFLLDIQILHDTYTNWTNTGLSEKGLTCYNEIVEKWIKKA